MICIRSETTKKASVQGSLLGKIKNKLATVDKTLWIDNPNRYNILPATLKDVLDKMEDSSEAIKAAYADETFSSDRIFDQMLMWHIRYSMFKNDPEYSARPSKGMMIFGSSPSERSKYVNIFRKGIKVPDIFDKEWTISLFQATDLISQFNEGGPKWWEEFQIKHRNNSMIIEEAGSEEPAKYFEHRWTIGDLLNWRYECHVNNNSRTIITSNFETDVHLAAWYAELGQKNDGDYNKDAKIFLNRIREMMDIVHFKGGPFHISP